MSENFNPFFYVNNPTIVTQIQKLIEDYKKGKCLVEKLIEQVAELNKNIADIIQQMYLDGKFDEAIKNILEPWLAELETKLDNEFSDLTDQVNNAIDKFKDFPATLDFGRIQRWNFKTGKNDYSLRDSADPYYSQLQGGTVFTRQGIEYFAGCFYPQNTTATYANTIQVRVYQLGNYSPLYTFTGSFDHGNSICYNPSDDCLYITHLINAAGTVTNAISRLNIFSSSPAAETVNFNSITTDGFIGIAWDENFEKLAVWFSNYVYHIEDFSAGTGSLYFQIPTDIQQSNVGYTVQNFTMNNDFAFFLVIGDAKIYVVDLQDFSLKWQFNLPAFIDRQFPLGEPEAISIYNDGTIYLMNDTTLGHYNQSQYHTVSIFKSNIYTNYSNMTYKRNLYIEGSSSVYVDNTIQTTNPIGTETNPFNCVQEAIDWVTYAPRMTGNVVIRIKNCDYDVVSISTPRSLILQSDTSSDLQTLGGVVIYAGMVGMRSLKIFNNTNRNDEPVTIEGGILTTYNNTWGFSTSDPHNNKFTQGVYSRYAVVNCDDLTKAQCNFGVSIGHFSDTGSATC